jgi:dihydrofolate reductase
MKHFKRFTLEAGGNPSNKNAVLMGRKTWESIDEKYRPLAGRVNVVLSKSGNVTPMPEGVLIASSFQEAAELVKDCYKVFVIGGAQIYEQAIREGYVNTVVYTDIKNLPPSTKCDTFFPELSKEEWTCTSFEAEKENESGEYCVDKTSGLQYKFLRYERQRTNNEEQQYLDLCREILDSGIRREDRTGTGTLSKFGAQMRFSLRDDTMPLLTTKRTFWRGVAEELLWFIQVRSLCFTALCINLYIIVFIRATQTPRISLTKTFISGMEMARENSWTRADSPIEKKVILVQYMGFSGVTLALNTLICTPTTPVRGLTSWRNALTKSRTIQRIVASFCQLGTHLISGKWRFLRAICFANFT